MAPTCKDGKPLDMHIVAPQTDEWCEKYPATLGCRDGHYVGTARPKAVTPRTVAPAPFAPSSASSVTPPEYRLPAPPAGRRGSPVDIRLGELDWRLIPAQSDLLIGINMGSLAESEVARTLISEWAGKLGATPEEQERVLAGLGDVTTAVISIHQKEVLAVLVGNLENFPQSSQVGGLQTMRVSADTVMLGSPEAFRWAMFRLKFPLTSSAQIREAQQLNQTYHFWAWAKPAALAALGQGVRGNSPITKLKFGANLKDGFRMDVMLDTVDAAAAKRVMASSLKTAPSDMQVSIDGSSVHYALILDRSATLARFGSFMTDAVGRQFAPLVAAARQIAASKASGAPGTTAGKIVPAAGKIVIEGLDDGPKEIPLSQQQ